MVLVHAGWWNGSPNSFDVAVVTGDVLGLVAKRRLSSGVLAIQEANGVKQYLKLPTGSLIMTPTAAAIFRGDSSLSRTW